MAKSFHTAVVWLVIANHASGGQTRWVFRRKRHAEEFFERIRPRNPWVGIERYEILDEVPT